MNIPKTWNTGLNREMEIRVFEHVGWGKKTDLGLELSTLKISKFR